MKLVTTISVAAAVLFFALLVFVVGAVKGWW